MISKIEVYIRNEEVATGGAYIGRPIKSLGQFDHWCTFKETLKTERVVSDADKLALELANEIAREKGLQIEVCDVSSFKGKLKCKSKGVTKTPTIIVGDARIEGIPTKEQMLNLLKQ